jgi:hypothetical protein
MPPRFEIRLLQLALSRWLCTLRYMLLRSLRECPDLLPIRVCLSAPALATVPHLHVLRGLAVGLCPLPIGKGRHNSIRFYSWSDAFCKVYVPSLKSEKLLLGETPYEPVTFRYGCGQAAIREVKILCLQFLVQNSRGAIAQFPLRSDRAAP